MGEPNGKSGRILKCRPGHTLVVAEKARFRDGGSPSRRASQLLRYPLGSRRFPLPSHSRTRVPYTFNPGQAADRPAPWKVLAAPLPRAQPKCKGNSSWISTLNLCWLPEHTPQKEGHPRPQGCSLRDGQISRALSPSLPCLLNGQNLNGH